LKELCTTFYDHIKDLEVRLEKAKHPPNTSNKAYELRAELKDLKDAVLVNENSINGMGDKPTGSLTQTYWAGLGDKRAIPWEVINKYSEEDSRDNAASSKEDNVKGAAKVNATSIEEDDVEGAAKVNATSSKKSSSKAKPAKLAKLVEMAKSTDLWCLSPFVPLKQEAKPKQRKVCPVNLRERSARPTTAAANTQRSALWPTTARGRSGRPCARCGTCGSRLWARPRETSPGGGAAPTLPPAARRETAARPRPGWSSRTSTLPS
jgi:hypothetical protein